MTNVFIIHHARIGENLYWIPTVKRQLELTGEYKVIAPLFPDLYHQSYESWAETLDRYIKLIDEDSVFVGYSTGAIFSIKYLIENNLKIKKFISVAGFNNFSNPSSENEIINAIDCANKSFFLDDIEKFSHHCDERVSFFSDNDNLISQRALREFATSLKAKQVVVKGGGHFNSGTAYQFGFDELLKEF